MQTDRPIIFGEVLFDTFPDGSEVLGGAPFNVAWHLQGFGLTPLFISRIGDDERGKQVLQAMERWGLSTEGIQLDCRYPTGVVTIALADGQPNFNILPDQAYGFIDINAARDAFSSTSPSLLYYGSLINRSHQSQTTLKALLDEGLPSFVDINLRSPWWNITLLKELLSSARWLKLNDAEVEEICQERLGDRGALKKAAKKLASKYKLDLLIVTMGSEGAFLIHNNHEIESPPAQVNNLVDTVGAGDAFASVMLLGLMKDWSLDVALGRAIEFAAAVCEVQGATIMDKDFYSLHLERWK